MIDLKWLQKRIFKNKQDHGFNTTDVYMEFCSAHNELGEASDDYAYKGGKKVGEELADAVIYILGIAEMLGYTMEEEILKKVAKIEKRVYTKHDDGSYTKTEG